MKGRIGWPVFTTALVVLAGAVSLGLNAGPGLPDPQWQADGPFKWGQFGAVVGTAGDVNGDGYDDILVMAGRDPDLPSGWLNVYHGSREGLAEQPAFQIRIDSGGRFGAAWAGDVNGDGYSDVIVGAPEFDHGIPDDGQAQAYLGSPSGLVRTAHWEYASGELSAQFGFAVSAAGDVDGDGFADVLVGAPGYDRYRGRVYLFGGSRHGLSATPAWTFTGDPGDRLGTSVASAGDVNGDGYADILAGAPGYDKGHGRAHLFYGSANGPSPTPDQTFFGTVLNGQFGDTVGSAGDVNGDGFADIFASAPQQNRGSRSPGAVYVYHGAPGGPANAPSWTAVSPMHAVKKGFFGVAASTAGDANCDGFADMVIGEATPWGLWMTSGSQLIGARGRVALYYGSHEGLHTSVDWEAGLDQKGALFGFSAGTAGDVNGDQCDDLVIAAPFFDFGNGPAGRVFLYHGDRTGIAAAR